MICDVFEKENGLFIKVNDGEEWTKPPEILEDRGFDGIRVAVRDEYEAEAVALQYLGIEPVR